MIGAGVSRTTGDRDRPPAGAVASAYDLRPAAKEQVQSLGGRFVELPDRGQGRPRTRAATRERRTNLSTSGSANCLGRVVAESDVVITAAVIPGKRPPCWSRKRW